MTKQTLAHLVRLPSKFKGTNLPDEARFIILRQTTQEFRQMNLRRLQNEFIVMTLFTAG
jgi:hypothetical protein